MVSETALTFIRDALELAEGDRVLEIGPGLGFLTSLILEKNVTLVAVEKDKIFASRLSRHFDKSRVQVFPEDILNFDLKSSLSPEAALKVAGNIPYNITSPILEWLIIQREFISCAVLTVQREVAERLGAKPGTKAWGALSIFIQVYSKAEVLKQIPRSSFFPAPNVDSAVVKFNFSKKPLFPIKDEDRFFGLVRRAFQKRRKTILNALFSEEDPAFSKEALSKTFSMTDIDPMRRSETLSIPEWCRLTDRLL